LALSFNDILLPVLSFAAVIVATWIVAHFAGIILGRILRTSVPSVGRQARRFVWVLILAMGVLIAIEQTGLRLDLLLLILGLCGAALIISMREPLENISARYFSDLYVPFKVGDSVSVRGYSGRIIEINPMSTVLLSDSDQLVSIPNSVFLREAVVNTTPQAWKEVLIPISLDGKLDVAEFESLVLKSCNKLKLRLDGRFPPILTVKSRSPQSTELLLTLMIREPGEKDSIMSEVNSRIVGITEELRKKKA
jgi:small conductance mechanosensitive channel